MVPNTNHVSHGIIMECANIINVVYQAVLDKWVDSTNTISDWQIYASIQPLSPLRHL
jgi:hypothetical protein